MISTKISQVLFNVITSSVGEVTHEVKVMLQAEPNIIPTMELMIKDKKSDDSAEEMIDVLKNKSDVPKMHICPECNKVFFLCSYLNRHLKLHANEMKCSGCSKMFFFAVKLGIHIKTHHIPSDKVKNILCAEYSKGFYKCSDMMVHLRTHGERHFPCDPCHICGEGFVIGEI